MPKIQQARQPLDENEERQVRRIASSRHDPCDWVLRARIVTRSWDGERVNVIASNLCCSTQTVRRVLHRFNEEGFEGLEDRPRPGRKPRLTVIERHRIIALASYSAPAHQDGHSSPQWSLDALTEMAHATGIQVQRSQIRRILLHAGVRWRRDA